MNGVTDWLANVRLWQVLVIAGVLFGIRAALKQYKTPMAKWAAETADSALIAVVLVFLVIRPFVVQAFFIPSASMRPTLLERDHILVSKLGYRFGHPKRGDIIVFKAPPEASPDQKDFIKRLVGIPGDELEVKDGALYRNGKRLHESYLNETVIEYTRLPVRVPKGKYFVMGDNRNYSFDSHEWGPLDQNRLIGKAMVRFWPPNRMGLVH